MLPGGCPAVAFDADAVPNGIYRVHWGSDGTSVASVYRDESGSPIIAPANWVRPSHLSSVWQKIHWLELVERAFPNSNG